MTEFLLCKLILIFFSQNEHEKGGEVAKVFVVYEAR